MTDLALLLSEHCGGVWTAQPLSASSFCATWRADRRGPGGPLFVKSLPASDADVLAAEADGLAALAATQTIRVPRVIGCWSDSASDLALLAMEWLDLQPMRASVFDARFGGALAALHRAKPCSSDGRFGWRRDNRLGATPQRNRWSREGGVEGWIAFFASERLVVLRDRLRAAHAQSELISSIDRVIAALPTFFEDGYVPRPSLIHGDLWSGNWAGLADGTPVIFDPAVSISDAEAELAMMELFGAPGAAFWQVYRDEAALASGYQHRRGLYQLYHLLNHELIFGGYARQAMATMHDLLKGA